MAGGQERILRRRIRSVQSTKKITKAMELIAASRIVRAQSADRGQPALPRGHGAHPAPDGGGRRPGGRQAARHARVDRAASAILAIVGDRGLAGSYNSGVLRATERLVAEHRANGAEVTVWSRRQEGAALLPLPRHRGGRSPSSGFVDRPEFADARHVAAVVAAPFVAGEIDLVAAGLDPLHLGRHPARRAPAAAPAARCPRRTTRHGAGRGPARGLHRVRARAREAAGRAGPACARGEIFAALLEGTASFFTAQQRAMAAATENADELVRTLTRVMNRARQDAITTEIMEIVGGAEALRQSKGA